MLYLPHLDYALQCRGTTQSQISAELSTIDTVIGELLDFLEGRGVQCVLMSEYGVCNVEMPVYTNRALWRTGVIEVPVQLGRKLLDTGASKAFAVADLQVAHV